MGDPEPALPPQPLFPRGVGPTGMSNTVTLVMGFVLIGIMACLFPVQPASERVSRLQQPVDLAIRTFERELALQSAFRREPEWKRLLLSPIFVLDASTRPRAIEAFSEILANNGYASETRAVADEKLFELRARRLILLAEAGRLYDANDELLLLEKAGHGTFTNAVRFAYADVPDAALRPAEPVNLALAGDGWIGARLRDRWAIATGAESGGEARAIELQLRRRFERAGSGYLVMLGVGIVCLLAWLARNRPDGPELDAPMPPLWPMDVGLGVLVRSAFFGILIAVTLTTGAHELGWEWLDVWVTLLASIPMVLWIRRHALAPLGLGFARAFGLVPRSRWLRWTTFTLGLFALDQIGSQALASSVQSLGASSPWAEGINEELLWGSLGVLVLGAIDACVWTPLFEEIGCRGMLYGTLRQIHRPLRAALFSGGLFALLHGFSVPGLVAVLWSGVVYALAYERSKSLFPAIVCHALNNVWILALQAAMYR